MNFLWFGITQLADIHSTARDWGFLALSIFALGMVGWFLVKRQSNRQEQARPQTPTFDLPPEDIPNCLGTAYPHRSSFEEFKQKIEDAHEVWAFWHTGASVGINPGIFGKGRIRKLVLIAPSNPGLKQLSEVFNFPVETIIAQIEQAETAAKNSGCEVKYWHGPITNSVTIGNPNRDTIWCEIEALLPFVDVNDRPHMEFRYGTNFQKCKDLEGWFLKAWSDRLCQETNPGPSSAFR